MKAGLFLDDEAVRRTLDFPRLVRLLAAGLIEPATVPERSHLDLPQPGGAAATLLLMPAWNHLYLGVKSATIHPGNSANGLPAVHATYLLSRAETGEPLAVIDGTALTARRTAAVAALAADLLSRPDASRLLVVGAGTIAALLPHAYHAVRPIGPIEIWNHRAGGAEALAASLRDAGFDARAVKDLGEAVGRADLIGCATLSRAPLVEGSRLRPGTHLDLIGGFTPEMRECDDACVAGARLFVDTPAALDEAGDLVQPLATGLLARGAVAGTLAELAAGRVAGRRSAEEITLFKSVGTALADLVVAAALYEAAIPGPETRNG
jgi:ornithine cyclodeaminase